MNPPRLLTAAALLLAATLTAHADIWQPHHISGDGRSFNKTWFASASTGWAVGNEGLIYGTSDGGTTWSWQSSGTPQHLRGVWGSDAGNVWALGDSGTILRRNGSAWSAQTSGTTEHLYGMWGSDASHVWAVGNSGTILKWDGSAWSAQTSGTTQVLYGVWGSDASNIWAVGLGGIILKWDGSTWSAQSSGTTQHLYGVWGSDASNVWAVGGGGTILKWNGSAWSAQSSGTTQILRGVWGSDASTIWAIGSGGTIVKWDGATWSAQTSGTTQSLFGVSGVDASHIWAVGGFGTVLKGNGSAWSVLSAAAANILFGVWGSDASNIWAVGTTGMIRRWDGTTWSTQTSGSTQSLLGVWGSDASNVWAVGNNGTILRWNGSAWNAQTSGTTQGLYSMWGSDASNVWAVGGGGTILRWNGSAWSAQSSGTTQHLYGVWGSDASNVWAVGNSGTILKWDGSVWSAQTSGTTQILLGVWGSDASNVWAVGASGTILKWNGSAWSAQTSGISSQLNGVWGSNASNVWAVGASGTILKWNGSAWSADTSNTVISRRSVWGTSATSVLAAGESGLILTNASSVAPPTVTVVNPSSGSTAGGTSVTITGTNFTGATAVTFGGTNAASFTVDSATQITATTPAGSAGPANVLVTTPGGTNAVPVVFTYVEPEIAVSGNSVDIADGDTTPDAGDGTEFGSVDVSSGSVARSFTLTNSGAAVLNLTGSPLVELSGSAAFSVSTQPAGATVAASGGTRSFEVTFDPAASGLHTATVSIANDDADEDPFTFTVRGWGAVASSGVLDTAFSGDGKVIMPTAGAGLEDRATSMAVQPDGKVVLAGYTRVGDKYDFGLVRYLADGALDSGFGSGGIVTTPVGVDHDVALAVAVQPDGKIVAAGYYYAGSGFDSAVVRYLPDGSLDSSFGSGGKAVFDFSLSSVESVGGVAVQADGKIVLAGQVTTGGTSGFVARLTADGVLDGGFGTGGVVTLSAGGDTRFAAVQLQADGRIVTTGWRNVAANNDIVVARLTTAGALDSTFDTDGWVTTAVGTGTDVGNALVIQPADGKIVVAGAAAVSGNVDFAVLRYTPAGALDSSFGTGGVVTVDVGGFQDEGKGVALQADGKIVVGGHSFVGSTDDFSAVRLTSAGVLDSSFDGDGKVITPVGLNQDYAMATAVHPDGGILLAGYAWDLALGGYDFALVRYGTGAANAAPTDITLTPASIAENNAANATVGVLDAVDADGADTHTFTLVAGTGDADNGSFSISGTDLILIPSADFETKSSYSLRVQADDGNGGVMEKPLTVTITNVNEVPAFAKGADRVHIADSGAKTVAGWATGIDDGDSTVMQTVGFEITGNSNPGLFSTAPAVAANGTLTYSLSGALGSSMITLRIVDDSSIDGQPAQMSATQSFTITNQLQPGQLDTAFHQDGINTTTINSNFNYGRDLVVLPTGRIVMVGNAFNNSTFNFDFALTRYTGTGDLDPTFGTGGRVTTNFGSSDDVAMGVAVQGDGRLVVAGYAGGATNDFGLARYHPDGTLDTSFGTAGKATTDFSSRQDYAHDVALQADGKIVLAGASEASAQYHIVLARYTSAGALDTTFGTGGRVTTTIGGSTYQVANAVAVQSDGKILVGGYRVLSGDTDFVLIRYTSGGTLDAAFGTGGIVTTQLGSTIDQIHDLILQADGKIVVAGMTGTSNFDFVVARYLSSGVLDTTFGGGTGWTTTAIGSGHDTARAVALQQNGKIVVAGHAAFSGNEDFALARYTPAGVLDTTFGAGGKITLPIGSSADQALALGMQTNGKIVAGGYASSGTQASFAIARFHGDLVAAPVIRVEQPAGQQVVYDGNRDFGQVAMGGHRTMTFSLGNAGSAELLLTGTPPNYITVGGPHAAMFSVTTQPTAGSFPAGGVPQNFVITYTPGAAGHHEARVTIASTDTEQDPFSFLVFGEGLPPMPTDITLTPASIAENNAANATVGVLSGVDGVPPFSFVFVTGTGDTDNGSFTIDGDALQLALPANFEAKSSYSVRVQAQDSYGQTYDKPFTVTVTNVNEMPSFTKGADISVVGGVTTAQTAPGWATAIDDGDSTVTQALTFDVSNDNNAIFSVQPAIASNGTLTFTPSGTPGTATVSVTLTDDSSINGQPALTTAAQTFTISMVPVARDVTLAWASAYSGPGASPGSGVARAVAVQKSGTGPVAVYATGFTTTASGGRDVYTVKHHPVSGALLWEALWDGAADAADEGAALVVDPAGDVIVTGHTTGAAGDTDVLVVKYDGDDGTVLWQRIYAGPGLGADAGASVAVDAAGRVAVAGHGVNASGGMDWFLARYAVDGTPMFEQLVDGGGAGTDQARAVGMDAAGHVTAAGYRRAAAGKDFLVRSFDGTTGAARWQWLVNGATSTDDEAFGLAVEAGGGVVATGTVRGSTYDLYTVRLDGAGALQWERLWDSPFASSDAGHDVVLDSQGDVIVAGTSYRAAGVQDGYAVKYDGATGAQVWSRRFNGAAGQQDLLRAVDVDMEDNAVVTGYSQQSGGGYDILTAKLAAADGSLVWERLHDGTAGLDDEGLAVGVSGDGHVYVAGQSARTGGSTDFLVLGYVPVMPAVQMPQVITFAPPGTQGAGAPLQLTATADSGLEVYFQVISGPALLAEADRTRLEFSGPGTVVVRATQPGNFQFAAAAPVERSFEVVRSDQTIDFDLPASVASFTQTVVLGAAASSGLPVTYGVVSGPGFISGNELSFSSSGIVVVRANQAGDARHNAAPEVQRSIDASNTPPVIIPGGIELAWQQAHTSTGPGEGRAVALQLSGNDAVAAFVAGHSSPAGNRDIHLMKFLNDGSPAWPAPVLVNGPGNGHDEAAAVAVDAAGDAYVCGQVTVAAGNTDIYVAKFSGVDGTLLWSHTFGGSAGGLDAGTSLALGGGSVIIGGHAVNSGTGSDFFAARLQQGGGAILWSRSHNSSGSATDQAAAVAIGTNGDIALGGISANDAWTLQLSGATGDMAWQRRHNAASKADAVRALAIDANNDIVITAYSQAANYDIHTAKYSRLDGSILWTHTYNSSFNSSDAPWALALDSSGDVLIAGTSYTAASVADSITLKYDGASGALLWQQRYNGPAAKADEHYAIALDGNNNPVVTGYSLNADSTSDVYTAKLAAATGFPMWEQRYDGPAAKNDAGRALAATPAGSAFVAGYHSSAASIRGVLLLKYQPPAGPPPPAPPGGEEDLAAAPPPPAFAQMQLQIEQGEPARLEAEYFDAQGNHTVELTALLDGSPAGTLGTDPAAGHLHWQHDTSSLTPGAHELLITATDTAGATASLALTLEVTPTTRADRAWRWQHFGTTAPDGAAADEADPDSDGLNNLGELAFGLDPRRGGGKDRLARLQSGGTGGIQAIYRRRKDHAALGLRYQVQFSSNLKDWFPGIQEGEVIHDDGLFEEVATPFPLLPGGIPATFFRIQVNPAP